jgi:UPF0716 protein FxsA
MRLLLLAAIFALPVLDIASLIEVGDRIGVWPTVVAVVAAAVGGTLLVRAQGLAILAQARATLSEGWFPARAVFDGACVLIGGALLIFPGFVSDVIGLLLLAPPVRGLLSWSIDAQVRRSGRFAVWTVQDDTPPGSPRTGPTIDGEYVAVAPECDTDPPPVGQTDAANLPASPWRRKVGTTAVVPSDDP